MKKDMIHHLLHQNMIDTIKIDDNDYDKGDITTAVLIGGVIGAVIAKNT